MNMRDTCRLSMGETLVETLAAIVLVTLASIVLITATTTAIALNRSSDEQSNQIANETSAAETNNASIIGSDPVSGSITFSSNANSDNTSAVIQNINVTYVGGNSVVSYSYEDSNTSGS